MKDAFRYAHAMSADWTEAARVCMAKLGAIPAAANLGFLYVSDAHAGELDAILAFFRSATGVPHWTGSVGIGVCATGIEYMDAPAIAVMLGEFEPGRFQMLPPVTRPEDLPDEAGYLAFVHGDPGHPQIQTLIEGLARRTASGFVVGGLSSARGDALQICDGVVSGGLSGVLFDGSVNVATRLSQGIAPLGARHIITEATKNIIGSLDHRPALAVMKSEIGEVLARDLRRAAGYIFVGLPVRGSDTGDYMVRNILGVDPQHELVAIGEYVEPGDELLFCKRDTASAEADLVRMLNALKTQRGDAPIRGGVYVSCLGRSAQLFGVPHRELGLIREVLGEFPLVGFFANGEISHDRLYGYTGVLTLFG